MRIFRFWGFVKRRKYLKRFIALGGITFLSISIYECCFFSTLYVFGRKITPQEEIKACFTPFYRKSIFFLHLPTLHEKISKLLWVKSVTIKRRFPQTIYLSIQEKKPIALWFFNKKNYFVDEEGDVLTATDLSQGFSHLFCIFGEDAHKEFPNLLKNMQSYQDILRRATRFTYIRKRRWDLLIDNSVLVKLPDENLKIALDKLRIMLENYDFKVIDLRIPKYTFVIYDEKV